MIKNTDRRRAIIAYIKAYEDLHGVLPTVREVCAGVGGLAASTVHDYIKRLTKEGFLEMMEGLSNRKFKVRRDRFEQEDFE